MNSTAILSEILIIGIFGLVWIVPIVGKFIGIDIGFLYKNGLISALSTFAIIYCVGILINFLSDILYKKIDKIICSKYGGKEKIHFYRSWILVKSNDASNYMAQRRSFVRIHRSNSINFLLIFLVHIICGNYIQTTYKYNITYISYLFLFLFFFSFYAYIKTLNGYFSFISQTKEVIDEIN